MQTIIEYQGGLAGPHQCQMCGDNIVTDQAGTFGVTVLSTRTDEQHNVILTVKIVKCGFCMELTDLLEVEAGEDSLFDQEKSSGSDDEVG